MTSYQQFAWYYDQLMEDAPYDQWFAFLHEVLADHTSHPRLLDIGCGTGAMTLRLAQAAYDVTGVDLSEDMLTIARYKADNAGLTVPFFQQDMTELSLGDTYDVVLMFCDSLNYLQTEEEVQTTFERVYEHLNDDGLFVFDVHTINKLETQFIDQTYADQDEDLSLIWQSYAGDSPHSVVHALTFFVREEDGRYSRFDEDHEQRTFASHVYRTWLEEKGFDVLHIVSDFSWQEPTESSERLFFVAKKRR